MVSVVADRVERTVEQIPIAVVQGKTLNLRAARGAVNCQRNLHLVLTAPEQHRLSGIAAECVCGGRLALIVGINRKQIAPRVLNSAVVTVDVEGFGVGAVNHVINRGNLDCLVALGARQINRSDRPFLFVIALAREVGAGAGRSQLACGVDLVGHAVKGIRLKVVGILKRGAVKAACGGAVARKVGSQRDLRADRHVCHGDV